MEKTPMTAEGHAILQDELRTLKTVERPTVIKAIAAAREHGDLSENAEYHAARERQSFIEGRIGELEDATKRAEIIDTSKLKGKTVRFGAKVKLADEDSGDEITYQLVGEFEADLKKKKISIASPLGKALIGREADDSVEVQT
ncbi:MAG: transcription elongation factor GreA, partial [Alphaproteobacteria bacterium]